MEMISSGDFVLELCNVFYSGQVEPASCMQHLLGTVKTGVILKDVSIMVQSGEVLAVLGSKGSGKKALLDVISRRIQGPTRGQILLNKQPISLSLFQQRCGYVTHQYNFIPGLTVEQTLHFVPTSLSGYLKKSKVKQIMADLALSQVAKQCVENISPSELRRLMIGVQLIKDPVVLLLDEPTWNLDPLNTYLVISILSNAAKKYGTSIILTMEKPRSDVFPFLDRVLYLCLGDVVYAGRTREMLDYFNLIGFPCPQLENPLMYYLCLSTVDRRSRERFIESNNQIAALVEKFKIEGLPLTKSGSVMQGDGAFNKLSLYPNKRSSFYIAFLLCIRLLTATVNCNWSGCKQTFVRLLLQPIFFFWVWLFYNSITEDLYAATSKLGFIFSCMVASYCAAVMSTMFIYTTYKKLFIQETQEGLYGGSLFMLTYSLISIPFSLISTFISTTFIFPIVGKLNTQWEEYIYFTLVLHSCYLMAEQITILVIMMEKDTVKAAILSIYVLSVTGMLGNGIIRSFKGLQEWVFYLTYAVQIRYASLYLSKLVLLGSVTSSSIYDSVNCATNSNSSVPCLSKQNYIYLSERYSTENGGLEFGGIFDDDINLYMSLGISFGFVALNIFLHMLPFPKFQKAKLR